MALLRIMLEVRGELGVVLSLAHFNHKIRGADSDGDEQFVCGLAQEYGLDFYLGTGDAPGHARKSKQSLETAARELRYRFFTELLSSRKADKVATAHTMDDQAETVLMRLIRGAGTRGLAGIYPAQPANADIAIVRPLLDFRREDIRHCLEAKKQSWREDSTNADLHHTRNSIRHELLPMLAERYNPAIIETLSRTAEVARAEEEFWAKECERLLPLIVLPGKPVRGGGRAVTPESNASFGLSIEELSKQPEALQRRLIRAAAASPGIVMDMEHVADVLSLLSTPAKSAQLPGGWRVSKGLRELRFERLSTTPKQAEGIFRANPGGKPTSGYEYPLPVPGQVAVPEINSVVHARLLPSPPRNEGYNHSPSAGKTSASTGAVEIGDAALKLRSWHSGDRFWPAHTAAEKKVKELLQALKVEQPLRSLWPVVAAGEQVIWVQGTRPRQIFMERDGVRHALIIEVENREMADAGSINRAPSARRTSGQR